MYDKSAEYDKKPLSELYRIRDRFIEGILQINLNPNENAILALPFYNENLEYIRMKIAERIGRTKHGK